MKHYFWNNRKNRLGLPALGYIAATLPLVVFHLSFSVSAHQGFIDWCIPYWADCVSISKTGRNGLAYYIFKGGMIPAALLLGYFWQSCASWPNSDSLKPDPFIPWLGWIGSGALIAYTIALGHAGDSLQLLRRLGVVLFMGLTFIVQVRTAHRIKRLGSNIAAKKLLYFSLLILSIAIFSLFLDYWMGQGYDRLEDAFEWWLIMLLIIHLVAMSRVFAIMDS